MNAEEIQQLKNYFDSINIDSLQMDFQSHSKIIDVKKFIDSHISYCINNINRSSFNPYYERLKILKELLHESIGR